MIRGLTFDFWQTLFYDRDEPQRMRLRAAGMADALRREGIYRPPAAVLASVLACGRRRAVLADESLVEFTPWGQVAWILADLGVPAAETARILPSVAVPYSEGALVMPPVMFADAPQVLCRLAATHRLALICNTGASPGVVLRNVLQRAGLLPFFTATIFSDEVGWRKPHSSVFSAATAALRLTAAECAHVGDDPWTDAHGANQSGLRSILLTGPGHASRPHPSAHDDRATAPDLRVTGLAELPEAVSALAAKV